MSREAYGGGGQYGGGSSGSSSSSGGNGGGNRESYGGGGQYSGGNTSTSTGGNGRNPTAQFNNFETPVNIPEGAKETLAAQRQKAQYEISPMTNPKNKAIALGLSMLVPGLGTLYGAYKNATAMGYSIDNPFEGIFDGGEPTLEQINNLGNGGDSGNRDLQTQIISKAPFLLTQSQEKPSVVNEYFENLSKQQSDLENWSPGKPAPDGYRVVNMLGDTFLEKKSPSIEEMLMLPSPLSTNLQTGYNNAKSNIQSILNVQSVEDQYGFARQQNLLNLNLTGLI